MSSSLSKGLVGVELLLLSGDGSGLLSLVDGGEGDGGGGGGGGKIGLGRVSLLGLSSLSGEDNESEGADGSKDGSVSCTRGDKFTADGEEGRQGTASNDVPHRQTCASSPAFPVLSATQTKDVPGSVSLESLNVELLGLDGSSSSSVVDGNSKTLSLLLSDTGTLQLSEGESSTLSDLGVVSDGGASDRRSEGLERSDTKGGGLGLSCLSPAGLASGLVKPGADSSLLSGKGRKVQAKGGGGRAPRGRIDEGDKGVGGRKRKEKPAVSDRSFEAPQIPSPSLIPVLLSL